MVYKHFLVKTEHHITQVAFNRADKANSLPLEAWNEMRQVFDHLDEDAETRVIILRGEGNTFCAGIDLSLLMNLQSFQQQDCEGRKRENLRRFILNLQQSITSIEQCRKPVIAAIQGPCIGGGVDIVSACDMRFSTEDAYFCIKEIDMGLVADIGTLQRLPKIIAPGIMAELAYTGRNFYGPEAVEIGFVNKVLPDQEALMNHTLKLAQTIAAKPPLVVRGTKQMMLYTRDHSVTESLDYMATWNAAMLFSTDLMESFQSFMEKRKPEFKDS